MSNGILEIFLPGDDQCSRIPLVVKAEDQENPIVKQILELKDKLTKKEEEYKSQNLKLFEERERATRKKEDTPESTSTSALKKELTDNQLELVNLKEQRKVLDTTICDLKTVQAEYQRRLSRALAVVEENTGIQSIKEKIDAKILEIEQTRAEYQNSLSFVQTKVSPFVPQNIVQALQTLFSFSFSSDSTPEELQALQTSIEDLSQFSLEIDQEPLTKLRTPAELNSKLQTLFVELKTLVSAFRLPYQQAIEGKAVGITDITAVNALVFGLIPEIPDTPISGFSISGLQNPESLSPAELKSLNSEILSLTQQRDRLNSTIAQKEELITGLNRTIIIDKQAQQAARSASTPEALVYSQAYEQSVNQNSVVLTEEIARINDLLNKQYLDYQLYQAGREITSAASSTENLGALPVETILRPIEQQVEQQQQFLTQRVGFSGALTLFGDSPALKAFSSDLSGVVQGANSLVSGPLSQDKLRIDSYKIDDKKRQLITLEYDIDPVDRVTGKVKSVATSNQGQNQIRIVRMQFYINPERMNVSRSKNRAETLTAGGYVYTHWGERPMTIDMSGTTGTSAMIGIRGLNHFYEVSGKSYDEIYSLYKDGAITKNEGDVFFLDQLRTITKYARSTAIEVGFTKGWYGSYRNRFNENATIRFSETFEAFNAEDDRTQRNPFQGILNTLDGFGNAALGIARTVNSTTQAGLGFIKALEGIGTLNNTVGVPGIVNGIVSSSLNIAGITSGHLSPERLQQEILVANAANTSRENITSVEKNPFLTCRETAGYVQSLKDNYSADSLGSGQFQEKNASTPTNQRNIKPNREVENGYVENINYLQRNATSALYAKAEADKISTAWSNFQLGTNTAWSNLVNSNLSRELQLREQQEDRQAQTLAEITQIANQLTTDYRNDFLNNRGIFGNARTKHVERHGLLAPVRIRMYHEDVLYIGHFESFTYTRSADKFTVDYDMKFVVEEMYVFPVALDQTLEAKGLAEDLARQANEDIASGAATEQMRQVIQNAAASVGGLFNDTIPSLQAPGNPILGPGLPPNTIAGPATPPIPSTINNIA